MDLDSPEARAHAQEVQEITVALADLDVEPEMVAPTRDMRGHVRMNFKQMRQLIELARRGRQA